MLSFNPGDEFSADQGPPAAMLDSSPFLEASATPVEQYLEAKRQEVLVDLIAECSAEAEDESLSAATNAHAITSLTASVSSSFAAYDSNSATRSSAAKNRIKKVTG